MKTFHTHPLVWTESKSLNPKLFSSGVLRLGCLLLLLLGAAFVLEGCRTSQSKTMDTSAAITTTEAESEKLSDTDGISDEAEDATLQPPPPENLEDRLMMKGYISNLADLSSPVVKTFIRATRGSLPGDSTVVINEAAHAILVEIVDFLGLRVMRKGLNPQEGFAFAFLGPKGISIPQSFYGKVDDDILMMGKKGSEWEEMMETLTDISSEAFSSSWGAVGFRIGKGTYWYWLQGEYVVMASSVELLTSAKSLLEPLFRKERSENLNIVMNLGSLGRFLVGGLRFELASEPAPGPFRKPLKILMSILDKLERFSNQGDTLVITGSTDSNKEYKVDVTLKPKAGTSVHRWVQQLNQLDTSRLGFLPAESFILSGEQTGKVFHGAMIDFFGPMLNMLGHVLKLKESENPEKGNSLIRFSAHLDVLWKSRSGFTGQSLGMDPNNGFEGLWAEQTTDPEGFRSALKGVLTELPNVASILADHWDFFSFLTVDKKDDPGRRGKVRFRKHRLKGGWAEQAVFPRQKKAKRKSRTGRSKTDDSTEMTGRSRAIMIADELTKESFKRALLGDSPTVAFVQQGNTFFIAAGKEWKNNLQRALALHAKGNGRSPGALSRKNANHLLKTDLWKFWRPLLKRTSRNLRNVARTLKRDPEVRQRIEMDIESIDGLKKMIPGSKSEAILATLPRSHSVTWQIQLEAEEIVAWSIPFMALLWSRMADPGEPLELKPAGEVIR